MNKGGAGNVATVTITVNALVPTTASDSYSTPAGTALKAPAPGVLGNDNSNGGGPLSTQLVTTTTNGTLALATDGSFTYTPNVGFASAADSFTYRAVNNAGAGNTVGVTINVGASPPPTDPQPPTELYTASIVDKTVAFRFKPPATGPTPTGYGIEAGMYPGQVIASIPLDTSPIYTVLAPAGAFYVRVHSVVNGQRSAPSNEIRVLINVPGGPPHP